MKASPVASAAFSEVVQDGNGRRTGRGNGFSQFCFADPEGLGPGLKLMALVHVDPRTISTRALLLAMCHVFLRIMYNYSCTSLQEVCQDFAPAAAGKMNIRLA